MPVAEARRIGIVLHDFPAGGTERIAIRLANAWAGAGRAVTVFCGTTAGPAFRELEPAVRYVAANPAIPRTALSRLRLGRWLHARIAAEPVDVLVTPGNFHLPVLFAAGRLPCAVVAKLSNPVARRSGVAGTLSVAGRRLVTRHVDRVVAMSPALAREATGVLRAPCETLAEPILPAAPPPRRRPHGSPVILCAGRQVAQKDFSLALRGFAAMADRSARLVMLGDGPERAALEREADALGIAGRVRFVGHVPDIAPWLADAHAFLLTSRFEGYPAVLVEAIAVGVPVVTTPSSSAIPEILAVPACGLIAAPEPNALAIALHRVLAGDVDEAARTALVARHEAGAAAAAWLAMLDRVVAGYAR